MQKHSLFFIETLLSQPKINLVILISFSTFSKDAFLGNFFLQLVVTFRFSRFSATIIINQQYHSSVLPILSFEYLKKFSFHRFEMLILQ